MFKNYTQNISFWVLRVITYLIIIAVFLIFFDIAWYGIPAISWSFLTEFPRQSGTEGGIFPAIVGTFLLVLGAMLTAMPLGIASAIYLSEYAKHGKLSHFIRLAIVTLAGIPSIVFGLFGLGFFVIFMDFGTSILSGSLTLACMILPTIIVSSEEALRSIPESFREGSLALGATKWETIYKNILPCAVPGILTGGILGIGRAAGETAPILLTVAAFYLPKLPSSVYDQVMALPYHLYILATQHPDTGKVLPLQYGTAFILIMLVLVINIIAIILRSYFRKKYKW